MKRVLAAVLLGVATLATTAHAEDFTFLPPGDLIAGSGDGRVDAKVYAPGLLFPIQGKAYANSQVYMTGGLYGPSGSQCAPVNFSYPWRDNYCEERSWDMPLCPAGTGHQGQDIRAASCESNVHGAIAVVDGTITSIGSYSVYLTAPDGTRYDYLHMDSVQVSVGEKVKRGELLGKVSNNFGGTSTSVHLHFNIKQNIANIGSVYVPPYLSLVTAYQATLSQPPRGALELADCERLVGWAFDPEKPGAAVAVELDVDATPPSNEAQLLADRERSDLCDTLGSCNHAFAAASPLSLFDGVTHAVRLRAIDAEDATRHELLESPTTLACAPLELTGARRPLAEATATAWKLTSFWDELPADASALPEGKALPSAPKAFVDPSDAKLIWVLDGATRRKLAASDAPGWHMDPAALKDAGAAVLELAEGPPFPRRAVWVTVEGLAYVVDDAGGGGGGGNGTPSLPESTDPEATSGGNSASASCAVHASTAGAPLAPAVGAMKTSTSIGALAIGGLLLVARRRRSRLRSR